MAFKTSEKYKSVIYSGDCRHKLKLLFNGVELEDADVYCESLKVTSRILPNGSTRFSLDNFIAKEAELILHDIDTTKIQSPVNISIGTLVDGTYEYVPIGLFVVQDLPTTDKNKTTIKLRDYAVKFDFGYNAKDIIDENGGSVTKLQILQDICNKAGVETDITKFYGSNSKIGIYDNTITGRTYISYLAEQAGSIATIDRSGKLTFVQLKDLETVEIPLNIVEKYEDGEKYEISRVVYEDAIRKFEYGDESKDTLFINTANPYIDDEVLTNTLAGTQIETSDSSDNPVVSYKQYGYTKQNVYSGKNLLNVPSEYSVTGFSKISVNLPANTQFVFSVGDIVLGGTDGALIRFVDVNGQDVTLNGVLSSDNKSLTKTPTEDVAFVYIYSQGNYNNSQGITTTFKKLMISTDGGEYEPYVGGKASPSPDYPQEIEVGKGKNLFNKDLYTYDYITNNDTGNTSNAVYKDIPIYVGKPNTAYFVSTNFLNEYTPYGKNYMYVLVSNYAYGNSNWVAIGHTGALPTNKEYYNKTITSDADGYLYLRVYKSLSKVLYEELMANVEVQIEEGSVATSYLPYNTIESKSKTRNLYVSSSDIPTGYYSGGTKDAENTHNGDTSIKTISAWQGVYFNLKELIENNNLKVGDKVTFSIYFKTNFIPTMNINFKLYRARSDSSSATLIIPADELIINEWKRISFTVLLNEYSLTAERTRIEAEFWDADDPYYFGNNRTNAIWFASPQFEVGELTDYQVSNESSIQHHLGDNFLADKDYIENGVLNKNIGKVVLDGSENITLNGTLNDIYQYKIPLENAKPRTINAIEIISTHFVTNQTSQFYNNDGVITLVGSGGYCVVTTSVYKTVDDFKTWLSTHNVEVYYELATPEQIPLEITGELRTFEPNTIITNDLNSEMEVEYAMNQTQVSQILELNKNIPLNSFKTGKIIGNPAIDAYDIIMIVDDDKEFKTLATNDLTYNGVMINTFDTQIGKEAKKENVTLTPEATFKKWAKTEIDNVEASVKITTGKIEEAVLDLKTDVNNNSVNINNNYQEILGKFEGYTPTSQTVQLEKSVTQLQTDTYTKTEINTKLTDGSVTKVRTTSGTFDEDGMHYEKTGAPTKSTINEAGVSVDSSSSGEELLFAGYDKDINQTIVRTENLTVRRYLVVGQNTRIEDYTDEDGNVGGGLFIL